MNYKSSRLGAQHGGKPMDGLTGGTMKVEGERFEPYCQRQPAEGPSADRQEDKAGGHGPLPPSRPDDGSIQSPVITAAATRGAVRVFRRDFLVDIDPQSPVCRLRTCPARHNALLNSYV
jgi:hypothetical protein